jgi:hypothetical protein
VLDRNKSAGVRQKTRRVNEAGPNLASLAFATTSHAQELREVVAEISCCDSSIGSIGEFVEHAIEPCECVFVPFLCFLVPLLHCFFKGATPLPLLSREVF